MSRYETINKLRRLAADPSASANERAVAQAKADQMSAGQPDYTARIDAILSQPTGRRAVRYPHSYTQPFARTTAHVQAFYDAIKAQMMSDFEQEQSDILRKLYEDLGHTFTANNTSTFMGQTYTHWSTDPVWERPGDEE